MYRIYRGNVLRIAEMYRKCITNIGNVSRTSEMYQEQRKCIGNIAEMYQKFRMTWYYRRNVFVNRRNVSVTTEMYHHLYEVLFYHLKYLLIIYSFSLRRSGKRDEMGTLKDFKKLD